MCILALFKLIDASGMGARCAGSPGICHPHRPPSTPLLLHGARRPCVCEGAIGKVSIVWAGWPEERASSSAPLRQAIDGRQK